MTKNRHASIQQKLMRLVLITSGIVLMLTCIGFFTYEYFTFRSGSKDRLSTLGEVIASNCTASLAFDDPDNAFQILSALKAEKHIVAACLYDKKGNLFARYPANFPKYNLPLHPAADVYNYENGYLEGFQPVIQGKIRWGTLYLQSDLKGIYTRFERYGIIALLVIASSFLMAYLVSKRLQKTISAPILSLAATAGNISARRDYTARATKFDDDELGALTDAFNQMLAQIERQNAEITSFNHALEAKVNQRTNELEQANQELKLKSEFEETIIDSSVDVIAVFDKDYKYLVLNKHGREVFGVQEQDVIGKNLIEVFPKVKSSQMYRSLQHTFKTGEKIVNQNYKSFISDRIMQNFFIPIFNKDNEVYRVLVFGHDITDISIAHDKLMVVNKELEKSNQDLEQFAYVASHDLQEPLRKIQTFSQLLEQKLDNKEVAKKYIEKVISSAARMTDLIKAVLNYSKLANEKGEFEPVDLNEVVENIKCDLELNINEKEAVIRTDLLPVVQGNLLQLNQLFLNLISNSIKFSVKKPEIEISCSVVENIHSKTDDKFIGSGKFVELLFKDNGIGFEQHYAAKIFTVFQRLHGRQEYPGTGIGLALCKKIINNHNGYISVSSKPDEGTAFKIYLPVNA